MPLERRSFGSKKGRLYFSACLSSVRMLRTWSTYQSPVKVTADGELGAWSILGFSPLVFSARSFVVYPCSAIRFRTKDWADKTKGERPKIDQAPHSQIGSAHV